MQGSPHPEWQRRSSRSRAPVDSGRVYGGGTPAAGGPSRPAGRAGSGPRSAAERRSAAGGRGSATRRTSAEPAAERRGGAGAPPDRPADRGAAGGDKPRRRRTPLWAILALVVGALLALPSGVALAGFEVLNNRYAGNVQQENLLGETAANPGEELEGPLNILLLGVDAREDDTDDLRSDTIIVLHVPSSHDQAYLISIPRDSWVEVPGFWEMKITDAFFQGAQENGGIDGGTQAVASTLSNLAGLSFNAAAIVNFRGFERIIDEMGGIEYCVNDPTVSEHFVLVDGERMGVGRARREGLLWNAEQVRYDEGCQQMAGWQALDYVRQRKNLESGEGDYGRQRNQQQLLQAMVAQAVSSDVRNNVSTIDGLLIAAGDALIVDTNNVEMLDFAFTLRNIRPNDLISLRTNGGEYNSDTRNGQSVELLTAESLAMFEAAANDNMAQFVLSNPDFVDPD
ncbi:LCP family protein [Natronosporangium hydrolyticum]|uniref:LCP family protein n=1 Tax=Natronosporangium hydrolyticum TaxID=2811111 RepID=A0A895YB09_9ACTN|nr:LCP family protein [Natronosporangium hydrolyticum]QSB14964.1 LCP family protein [Natronosporangium hydrolyticum]